MVSASVVSCWKSNPIMSNLVDSLGGYGVCRCSFTENSSRYPRRFPLIREGKCKVVPVKYGASQFSGRVNGSLVDGCSRVNPPLNEVQRFDRPQLDVLPHVQTLREFPKEELFGKVVMVRFDSKLLHPERQENPVFSSAALSTIKYLHKACAKVVLVSSWDPESNSRLLTAESFAEFLSSILEMKVVPVEFLTRSMFSKVEGKEENGIFLFENLFGFKEESANCKEFAEKLSSGVDIFVNDDFSQCHKVLASTVGVARFCYACLAGFCFDQGVWQLKKISMTAKRPYATIVGGGSLVVKAAAIQYLASVCDSLVFVGNMAFQIMHALGLPVPASLIEPGAFKEALAIVECMRSRGIQIVLPRDFLCLNNTDPEKLEMFSADCLLEGWRPVDLGPKSLEEIASLLSKCKKILWIGPVTFDLSMNNAGGASKLAAVLHNLKQNDLEIFVVGKRTSSILAGMHYIAADDAIRSASVVWEFLKRRSLPGVMALDRSYPYDIKWDAIYADPTRSLVVDIGSGNGLFLLQMAKIQKDLNFLGLEINEKLVNRCVRSVSESGMRNGYFIRTNATSTFRSIVSSYPGELVLVSIQCPNPDFNKPQHRWRMLQRSLVEAIVDLLSPGGKVFLQSDIQAVALHMKNELIRYGKGKLVVMHELQNSQHFQGEWLIENPFGVRSDWEQHVLDRGSPMYRLLLHRSTSTAHSSCRG